MSVSFEFFEGLDLRVFYRVARSSPLEQAILRAVRREDGYSCDIERRDGVLEVRIRSPWGSSRFEVRAEEPGGPSSQAGENRPHGRPQPRPPSSGAGENPPGRPADPDRAPPTSPRPAHRWRPGPPGGSRGVHPFPAGL
jgi:hypothetical protein